MKEFRIDMLSDEKAQVNGSTKQLHLALVYGNLIAPFLDGEMIRTFKLF
jgi:hypothetical protein